jgi:hypothetical protein
MFGVFMRTSSTRPVPLAAASLALLVVSAATGIAAGPNFHVITYFNQLGSPVGLVEGSPGVFFSLGAGDPQRVFTITPDGSRTVIATFTSSQSGGGPLVAGDDNRFYSTVEYPAHAGGLFSVSSAPGSRKIYPVQAVNPGLTQNLPDGNLLGIATGPLGAFYLATSDLNGNVTAFYQFPSGETPLFIALYASDGNCYGVSVLPDGSAYVYRATLLGSVTKIYNFPSESFNWSEASSLIQASDGNLYGTTSKTGGYGSIYKLTLTGEYTPLYTFQSSESQAPAALIEASDGNLYGATIGGRDQLFRITTSGDFTVLRTMSVYKDGECDCRLIQGSDGIIYGAATLGGHRGVGDIFSVDAGLPKPHPAAQQFQPASGPVGTKVRIWGGNLLAASVQFNGTPATAVANSGSSYVWATVPDGATTGPITVTTPGGTVTTAASFTVQ